ncbi:MAG: S-layer protein, partial [Methanoregula sp.]
DIPPGGNVTAHYAISVASDAAPGTYPLNTEVRYRDALDNSQVSDTFTANVQVNALPPASPPVLIVEIFIVAMVIVAAGYYVVVVRKKR